MDGTFVYRHVSTGSLPVWVLVGGEMEGPFYVGRRLLVGGNTGMIVMMMGPPRSQVQFATDLRILPN